MFTNIYRDTVYLSHCGSNLRAFVERLDGSEWVRVVPKACPLAQVDSALPVAPGASHTFRLVLGVDPNTSASELIGTFRIRLTPARKLTEYGTAVDESVPPGLHASPTFTISL